MNYNFVIFGAEGYYEVGYHDIMNLPNVCYYPSYFSGIDNSFFKQVVRWNFSEVVNHYVKTPFAKIVYPRIFHHGFSEDSPICFVFFDYSYKLYQSSYIDYLRHHYPKSKMVLFMQDLVSRHPYIKMDLVKERMDLLLSYDKGDCKKYDMLYHPTPMSYYAVPSNSSIESSDVFYCGYAKSRWPLIHQLYEQLTAKGLTCDFHIMFMPKDAPRIQGIHYHENLMSYPENLQRINNSNCILEIMQVNATGFTPRLWESIVYNKHLLTNNGMVRNYEYYNKDSIHFIAELENIDILRVIRNAIQYSKEIRDSLSPLHLLTFIEDALLLK